MSKLKAALLPYLTVEKGELGKRQARTFDRDKLAGKLREIVARNNAVFGFCVAMVIIPFVVQLWVALAYASEPQLVKAIGGAFGISAAGLIFQMIKLWREKVATELLLELLPTLDTAVFKTVIAVLVRRLG